MNSMFFSAFVSFFQTPVNFAVFVLMCVYLVIAAIYDAHGTLIPDSVTLPYTLLGIIAAVFRKSYVVVIISVVATFLVLAGWTPKWWQRVSKWFVERSYGSLENAEIKEESYNQESLLFEKSCGRFFHIVTKIITATTPLVLLCAVACFPVQKLSAGMIFSLVICLSLWCICFCLFYEGDKKPSLTSDNNTVQFEKVLAAKEEEVEPLSAFGGADAIILIGLFAFYGFIPFMFALIPSFIVYIIFALISRLKSKDEVGGGYPMLPAFAISIPARLWVAAVIAPPIVEQYQWLFQSFLSY